VEPNFAEQAIIARVRQARADGMTFGAIVADLAARGFVRRTGRPFGLAQVAGMARGGDEDTEAAERARVAA
jgi:hypothetical protein